MVSADHPHRPVAARRTAWLGALLTTLLVASPAAAVEFHIQSETIGDAYQLVTSSGQLLNRNRIHEQLGFGAYDLLGDQSYSLSIVTRFRFDADLGITREELDEVATLRREQLSIQAAYVEGRDLFGMLDFKLGRLVQVGSLDWLMLDGAVVRLRTPWFFGVEVEAGVEASNDFGSVTANQLELDGVRVMKDQLSPDGDPIQVTDDPKIVLGATLLTTGLYDTRARFTYRRIFSKGKVRQERVGGAMYQDLFGVLSLNLNWGYDFYNEVLDTVRAGVRWRATDFLTAELQYVRLVPRFDAESIFNIFASEPLNDVNTRVRWHLSSDSWAYVGGMVRLFGNEDYVSGSLTEPVDTLVSAYGAMAGYHHGFGEDGRLAADVSFEGGYGGQRLLVDLTGSWSIIPGELDLEGRMTLVHFEDGLQSNLDGVSFGYQLGGHYDIVGVADLRVLVEHNFSRIHHSQLRVLAVADFELWL